MNLPSLFRGVAAALLGAALAPAQSATQPSTQSATQAQPQPLGPWNQAAQGYQRVAELPFPAYAAWAPLADGSRLVFDGRSLVRTNGVWTATIASYATFVFPSFVVTDGVTAWVGESTNGSLKSIDLTTGLVRVMNTLVFNYDAVLLDARTLLISAAPCGFSCGSDLYQLDLSTHQLSLRGHVAGPSGPLARDRAGNVWYGQNSPLYPAPPASSRLLRWSAAQVQGSALLSDSNATVIQAQLDGVADLAVDLEGGLVLVSQARLGKESEIIALNLAGQWQGYVARGTPWFSGLALLDSAGPGSFHAWSGAGTQLWCVASEFVWGGPDKLLAFEPRRAVAHTTGSGMPGLVTWSVSGAPAQGSWTLLAAPRQMWSGSESVWRWSDAPFTSAIAPSAWTRIAKGSIDSLGNASCAWQSPGPHLALQGLLRTRDGRSVGTTTVSFD